MLGNGGTARGAAQREQPGTLGGYRIGTAGTPGVAAYQTPQGQVTAGRSTVLLQGLQGIDRTGRFEPAGRAQPGAQQQTIAANQADQNTLQHGVAPDSAEAG